MDLKHQFFCKISDFGRKSAKYCHFSNYFQVKIRFSGVILTKIIFFTSTNVKFTLILFLMIFFRTNIAFKKIDFPKVKAPLRQIPSGMISNLESKHLKLSESGLRILISFLDQKLCSNLLGVHLSNFTKKRLGF